jgi:SAM-dependent methyltransferase
MNKSTMSSIDWEKLWEEAMEVYLKNSQNDEQVWNEKARNFNHMVTRTEYADEFISRMDLNPDFSILDVACGPGNLALPLAKQVKSVTALDQSGEMLRIIQENMHSSGIKNITCVHKKWEEAILGKDIKAHDIVISSRKIPAKNLRDELRMLNKAASKYVYLTAPTANHDNQKFYQEIGRLIGKPYSQMPEYIYYYNILYQEGILAHVDFIYYTNHYRFPDLDTAFNMLNTYVRVENAEQKDKFTAFLKGRFEKDGEFKADLRCRWALLWWKKEEA